MQEYGDVDVYTANFRPLKATLSGLPDRVFMKLIVCAKTNKVLGLHMCGEDSPEIVQVCLLLINSLIYLFRSAVNQLYSYGNTPGLCSCCESWLDKVRLRCHCGNPPYCSRRACHNEDSYQEDSKQLWARGLCRIEPFYLLFVIDLAL